MPYLKGQSSSDTDLKVQGIPPKEILCSTFTNKAAKELRERLASKGVKDVKVTTFHAFCAVQLRQFYKLLGYHQAPAIWASDEDLCGIVRDAMR